MRRTMTALLVTAALAGSTAALADRWQGNGDSNKNNGGQVSSGQDGSWQHGQRADAGSGNQGQAHFHEQTQNGGSGDHSHWSGSQSQSSVQSGSTFSGQHSWQGGGRDERSHLGGNNDSHVQWNGNNDGSSRHYRQDQGGQWSDHGDDHDRNWSHGDRHDNGGWNNGGHGNDWRAYRDSNRGLFHLPRYNGPRGYSYRRFYPGYSIDPFFYSQQYWIDDPYEYRLPPAYGPYRWVRYFNDALLIDIRNGEVEDVISDFFW